VFLLLLCQEVACGELADLAEGGEGFEEVLDEGDAGAFEGLREDFGGRGSTEDRESGADGLGLFGEGFGPGAFAGGGGGGCWAGGGGFVGVGVEAGLGGGAGGVLEFGAEPAG
jgi:hypothetical protein